MKRLLTYLSTRTALASAAFAAVLLTGCSKPEFKIKGEIEGADNQALTLQKSDFHGRWIIVDSTRTSKSGSFKLTQPAPASPDIYRLALGDKYIYMPVDSIETLTVTTTADGFGRSYTLAGSDEAVQMAAFDAEVLALPNGVSADSLNSFKRNVYAKYIQNAQGSIVAYYVLTKTLGDKALFNPEDDLRYFAAVATGFKSRRPNDPRTALLEETAMRTMKARNAAKGIRYELQAPEITVIDIDLPDENGNNRKLSDIVGNGKKTVVMFTVLTHPDSPAVNAALKNLYDSRQGAVNFYQVSLDPDQYAWRDAARNLPWTTVYDPDGEYSKAAQSYNVGTIPTFFIYNTAGELSDRAESIEELRKKI